MHRPRFLNPSVRLARAALLAAVAAGCARLPQVPEFEPGAAERLWAAHRADLSALTRWTLHGRLAVKSPTGGWSATVHWQQDADAYLMRVIAPMGRGVIRIEGDRDSVSVRTPRDETLVATDPEALLEQELGFKLPVMGLRYWILGLPVPGQPVASKRLDRDGRLERLEQQQWRLQYSDYTEAGDRPLPSRISLEAEDLTVRLVVQQWRIGS
jgi:outer membrane lipoprotein LolB